MFASPLGRRLGQRSGELSKPHPVNSVADQHLGMLAVAKIPPKHACAALPPHGMAGTPDRGDASGDRAGTPRIALARLAGFATG